MDDIRFGKIAINYTKPVTEKQINLHINIFVYLYRIYYHIKNLC